MVERLARLRRSMAIRGVILFIFGVLAIAWPGVTVATLMILFGAALVVDGVISLVMGYIWRRQAGVGGILAANGVVPIVLGIIVMVWPGASTAVLLAIVGVFAIFAGFGLFGIAGMARFNPTLRWSGYILAILLILFGIVSLFDPVGSAAALAVMVGVFAIVAGIGLVALAISLRGLHQQIKDVTAGLGRFGGPAGPGAHPGAGGPDDAGNPPRTIDIS